MDILAEDVSLKELCDKMNVELPELRKRMKPLGIGAYLLHGKKHVERKDAERLLREEELPEPLKVKTARAKFLRIARNARFIYAEVEGYPGKHLIGLTRRYWTKEDGKSKLEGKHFTVEVVDTGNGASFRHGDFIKKYMING